MYLTLHLGDFPWNFDASWGQKTRMMAIPDVVKRLTCEFVYTQYHKKRDRQTEMQNQYHVSH